MKGYLPKNTAKTIMVLMVDETDHQSGLAGLTLSIQASANGAAFSSISPTVTDRGNGKYSIALTSSHTATSGLLWLEITAAGADDADVWYEVVSFDPQNGGNLGLTALPSAAAGASGGLFTRGTGAGQINQNANGQIDVRVVGAASGALDRAALAQDLKDLLGEVRRFTAAGGSTSTVTFDAGASTTVDLYKDQSLLCVGGTGAGRFATVTAYSSGRVATLDRTFATAFDATSVFELLAVGGGSSGGGSDPFASIGEGSATYGDLIRLLVGVICGTVSDFETDTQAYRSLSGAKTRLTVTTDASGRIAIVLGDLT